MTKKPTTTSFERWVAKTEGEKVTKIKERRSRLDAQIDYKQECAFARKEYAAKRLAAWGEYRDVIAGGATKTFSFEVCRVKKLMAWSEYYRAMAAAATKRNVRIKGETP